MTSKLGATYLGDGNTEFLVWAPFPQRVDVVLGDRRVQLRELDHGYRHAIVAGIQQPGNARVAEQRQGAFGFGVRAEGLSSSRRRGRHDTRNGGGKRRGSPDIGHISHRNGHSSVLLSRSNVC